MNDDLSILILKNIAQSKGHDSLLSFYITTVRGKIHNEARSFRYCFMPSEKLSDYWPSEMGEYETRLPKFMSPEVIEVPLLLFYPAILEELAEVTISKDEFFMIMVLLTKSISKASNPDNERLSSVRKMLKKLTINENNY